MFDSSYLLDDLERAIDTLIATERPLDLPRLRRCVERLEAVWLQAVRVEDRDDSWLAHACAMSAGAARRAITTARRLDQLPATAQAFAAGEIGREHVDVIVRACTAERVDGVQAIESQLVEAARGSGPSALRSIVQRACDVIDGDLGTASANEQWERQYLRIARAADGMVAGRFLLDPESGETLIAAIEATMERDRERTPVQRRAAALAEVARRALANTGESGRRARPHVSVVVDLDVLRGQGHGAVVTDVRSDLEHAGRVSVATLRRLTCDAHVHRVLTDGKSEPLDVGRATRTVPAALWRALVVRDRHCQAPGCDRPPGWCEAHHLRHWADGGPTDLDNLILLCWRHHRGFHEGQAHTSRTSPSVAA